MLTLIQRSEMQRESHVFWVPVRPDTLKFTPLTGLTGLTGPLQLLHFSMPV